MKIIYKILFSCIIFYMAICQLNKCVFSYKIDEVKDLINYHEVATDGEPEGIDNPEENNIVQYELSNMEPIIEFPVIQTTVEMVVYGKRAVPESIDTASNIIANIELLDINFFNLNSSNESSKWKNIQNIVYTFTRIFTYISIALMLTLLIYMAVVIAYRATTGKIRALGFIKTYYDREIKDEEGNNLSASRREKIFIEQWIISLILLIFVFIFMSLIVHFTGWLESLYGDKIIENKEITVYVHDNTRTRSWLLFYD